MSSGRGVGLEFSHITLLVTGHHHILLVVNDHSVFSPSAGCPFDVIYAFIKWWENHKFETFIRLCIGRFPGGVRPIYTSIDGTKMASKCIQCCFRSFPLHICRVESTTKL